MAEHVQLKNTCESINSPSGTHAPLVAGQGWLMNGTDISIHVGKTRPLSLARHSHPEAKLWLFFQPASGVVTKWNAADEIRQIRLIGRQAFFIPPRLQHAIHLETDASLVEGRFAPGFFANVNANEMAKVVARESLDGAGHDRILWELASTIRFLYARLERPNPRLIEPMMAAIIRRIFACHGDCYAPRTGTKLSEDRTQLVVDYMEDHYSEKISVAELASLVGLSAQHFTELFHNRTGRTPIEYLRELRRMEAHKMILAGELRMGEIADRCGFCDEAHLNNQFKRFFCYTPKLLRTGGESA